MNLYPLVRPALFRIDTERAHALTIRALKTIGAGFQQPDPVLGIRVAGIDFPNPVGLAPGFDKNAEVFGQMLRFGFGFAEVGTLTPRPQQGNPRPRLFRLAEDRGVINRMGFNNDGLDAARTRLEKRGPGIVGVNVGANKDSSDRVADYAAGIRKMAPVADYLTVNISSPNTPGLRALQDKGALDELLAAVSEARETGGPPVFLKLAPDLESSEIDDIVAVAIARKMDALIIANTTLARPPLRSLHCREQGGLSGAPLKNIALDALRQFRRASEGAIPLIGAGGIENGQDAYARIRAGASLVQLYSAMVYQGPGIAKRIVRELRMLVLRDGYSTLTEAVGTES